MECLLLMLIHYVGSSSRWMVMGCECVSVILKPRFLWDGCLCLYRWLFLILLFKVQARGLSFFYVLFLVFE